MRYPSGQHNSINIQGPADSCLVMTAFPGPIKKHIYIACNKARRYELMPAVLALPLYTNAHQYSHMVIPPYSSKDKNQSQKFCLRKLSLAVVSGFLFEKPMDVVSGQVVPMF